MLISAFTGLLFFLVLCTVEYITTSFWYAIECEDNLFSRKASSLKGKGCRIWKLHIYFFLFMLNVCRAELWFKNSHVLLLWATWKEEDAAVVSWVIKTWRSCLLLSRGQSWYIWKSNCSFVHMYMLQYWVFFIPLYCCVYTLYVYSHAAISLNPNEIDLFVHSKSSAYIHPKHCNEIHVFVYMYIIKIQIETNAHAYTWLILHV